MSTVLALRGNHVTIQPFIDPSHGSVLCWNGEAWKLGSESIEGNDGQLLFDTLMRASCTQKCASESTAAILNVLQTVSGPFAFVFVDKIHSQLYFGRDRLGRRSLLYKIDADSHSLHLSSVGDPTSGPWLEVEADAIYQLSCEEDVGWKIGDSINGLLSAPVAPISKHLWENLTLESSVRSLS
jgi:asparagine synthetase B (glutamine-hydrolysing)